MYGGTTNQRRPSTLSQYEAMKPFALRCVSDIVQVVDGHYHSRILDLLDAMLLSGLTQEVIDTLTVISQMMPGQVR